MDITTNKPRGEFMTLKEHVLEFEKTIVLRELVRHQFHYGKTAVSLGMTRENMYRKFKNYGFPASKDLIKDYLDKLNSKQS